MFSRPVVRRRWWVRRTPTPPAGRFWSRQRRRPNDRDVAALDRSAAVHDLVGQLADRLVVRQLVDCASAVPALRPGRAGRRSGSRPWARRSPGRVRRGCRSRRGWRGPGAPYPRCRRPRRPPPRTQHRVGPRRRHRRPSRRAGRWRGHRRRPPRRARRLRARTGRRAGSGVPRSRARPRRCPSRRRSIRFGQPERRRGRSATQHRGAALTLPPAPERLLVRDERPLLGGVHD